MSNLLQDLKRRKDFEYLGSLGDDRHLFRVTVAAVEEHEDFQRLRGKPVEKIDLLQASMKRAGTSLYPVCVYAERDPERAIHLILVDGHQRLRAEKQNGSQRLVVQYV